MYFFIMQLLTYNFTFEDKQVYNVFRQEFCNFRPVHYNFIS